MSSAVFLDIFLSAVAMLLTTGSALAMPCRRAIQLDSSYEGHVAAAAYARASRTSVLLLPLRTKDANIISSPSQDLAKQPPPQHGRLSQ